MKKHTKIYLNYFNYSITDVILCEVCDMVAVDIHHINSRGLGGSNKDYINNLQALCRNCHIKYGDKKQYKEFLNEIHENKLKAIVGK
jgi:5-methylcytosine-specific restriction endonuclease McrA